jgi:hypothetical protein
MKYTLFGALALTTLMTACGDKPANVNATTPSTTQATNQATTQAATPAANTATPATLAQEYPSRKSGLWEATLDGGNLAKSTITQCVDTDLEKAFAKDIWSVGQPGANCRELNFTKTAEGFESSSTCELNGATIKSLTVIKGDFQSAYVMDIGVTVTSPRAPAQRSNSKFAATYKGPCPAGAKPGDMTSQAPGMPPQKLNAYDMLKLKK